MTAVIHNLTQPAQAAAPAEADEVSVDAVNLLIPGLIERVEV
ncbi:hypothetical protein [Streptomyces sp. NBC_01373]|nr:hypothetical protein [Streptomyces sp. NBC_01373]MCX4704362.1 hypothetical protein [Streptomyces sp. NBC_01373]MCX4707102.1 hypothetical protein [Streptomyces sp. NBC_01373]